MGTSTPCGRLAAAVAVLAGLAGAAGCAGPTSSPASTGTTGTTASSTPSPSPGPAGSRAAESDVSARSPEAGPTPQTTPAPRRRGPRPSDGTPRAAGLSIPQIAMDGWVVEPYRGTTDDAAGTAIQDGGVLASPFGPDGGVGPGGVGNYLVTGHRLSSSQAFLDLPVLQRGDRFTVSAAGRDYVYEVRRTRITSFRSPQSLAAQRAAVPGRPGVEPTRAMITLSTCRTPEDRAEGNTWSDEFGNPENRIDKIGVLVASRPA